MGVEAMVEGGCSLPSELEEEVEVVVVPRCTGDLGGVTNHKSE